MSLRKYHDVTIAGNNAAVYTLCLGPHKSLFRQILYSNFHKLIFKKMCMQKNI